MSKQPLSEADIIFPHLSNTPNFSSTLSSLRKSTLSVHNRLNSILSDSAFVTLISTAYDLPLVANERCGSWYIPPSLKRGSVYFKSTDGHMSQWQFSLRRLNLQLLDVVEKWGGAVIVDSTRRGKSMPDALSKTVPIWCCVINRVVFGTDGDSGKLKTPPSVVGKSEHAQIERRIEGFVKSFLDICKPDVASMRTKLQKPLRPIWVTQGSTVPDTVPHFADFHPIVLCTASRRVHGAETSENGYVQGAADDHEAWAQGLTPALFWKHKDELLGTDEFEVPALIERMATGEKKDTSAATLVKPTSVIYIASSEMIDLRAFELVISCTPEPIPTTTLKSSNVKSYVHIKCQTGKLGSRDLRVQLPRHVEHISSLLKSIKGKVLICCPSGKDLSVGTALAILCLYCTDNGQLDGTTKRGSESLSKDFIKRRLSWITLSNPALNPSRATLQSINTVLLSTNDTKSSTMLLASNLPIRTKPVSTSDNNNNNNNNNDNHNSGNRSQSNALLARSDNDEPPSVIDDDSTTLFSNLQNHTWKFKRTLTSALPSHPSGAVTGTATFTRCTTATHRNALLYSEQGEFTTDTGLTFTTRKKYVYCLVSAIAQGSKEATDKANPGPADEKKEDSEEGKGNHISIYFLDENSPSSSSRDVPSIPPPNIPTSGLFVEMGPLSPLPLTLPLFSSPPSFSTPATTSTTLDNPLWTAENKSRHLCGDDLYAARWRFAPRMLVAGNLDGVKEGEGKEREEEEGKWWEVEYDVKGPKKAYLSVTRYRAELVGGVVDGKEGD